MVSSPSYLSCSEPNLKSVRELIYKRGYGKVDKQRIPLSNNAVIEEALGKYDILSVEDLVHAIFTAGPKFKQVRKFQMQRCESVLTDISGFQLPLAVQALQPQRWLEDTQVQALRPGW